VNEQLNGKTPREPSRRYVRAVGKWPEKLDIERAWAFDRHKFETFEVGWSSAWKIKVRNSSESAVTCRMHRGDPIHVD
jgi:hypothetical protein